MQKTIIISAVLLLPALLCQRLPALAGDKGGNTQAGQSRVEEQAGQAKKPGGKDEFPGTGSYDAWKSSVPEFRAGWALLENEKYDQAIARLKASLALYPFQPKCYLGIGRAIEGKGGSIKDAEDAYRNSIKLDTANFRAWKRLANVLYIQKRYGEARDAIGSALMLPSPPKERAEMDKLVQAIEAAQKDADTSEHP